MLQLIPLLAPIVGDLVKGLPANTTDLRTQCGPVHYSKEKYYYEL